MCKQSSLNPGQEIEKVNQQPPQYYPTLPWQWQVVRNPPLAEYLLIIAFFSEPVWLCNTQCQRDPCLEDTMLWIHPHIILIHLVESETIVHKIQLAIDWGRHCKAVINTIDCFFYQIAQSQSQSFPLDSSFYSIQVCLIKTILCFMFVNSLLPFLW